MTNNDINKVIKNKYFLTEVPYNKLIKKIEKHEVSKIYFSKRYDDVVSEESNKVGNTLIDYTYTPISPFVTSSLVETTVKNNIDTVFLQPDTPSQFQQFASDSLSFVSNYFVPFVFISVFLSFIRNLQMANTNRGGISGLPNLKLDIKKDKENMKNANITINSFAGSPEIFEECTEVVSYLKNATLYKNAGAEIPKGILLEGPPGTGKTLLAKAIASEADASFVSISASEFVEVFVGVGASKIRTLFQEARQNKPCIIFIDEIDSVGRQRGAGINMANDEREQTLNQLLAEMDGFESNDGVLVIAATNRKDVLDAALLRPGRFDRIITVALPDKNSRKDILKVHSKNKNLDSNINLELIAEMTGGFSGAQIKNLLNEAAINAARTGNSIITETNILEALEKLVVGLIRKIDTRSDESRRRIAIHETGHALLCNYFNDYFELKKVTIQSTYNGAGGYTLFNEYQNITESGLYTKNLLKKQLIIAMGGKAAENIFYGEEYVSVGAVQDLKQANSVAQRMIGNYGMGKLLEPFYNENVDSERNPFLGRSLGSGDKYSEKTKEIMDAESLELVRNAYDEAKRILSENREKMDIVINELLEKNTIYGKDFKELLL
uniref:AAA+ ATPase domain-containing protein n=1 Tax=viral metagenome TaxID=1070528 RepID=A0A6C0DEF5_9ZZZZ